MRRIRIVLCLALALVAAASLAAVLSSLGALPADAVGDGYLLREVDGRVGVFYPADAPAPSLIADIRVADLPPDDRLALAAGVRASDRDAAARLLEDYGA